MSLPESEFVPILAESDRNSCRGGDGGVGGGGGRGGGGGSFGDSLAPVPEEDYRLLSFLKQLGLEKYAEVLLGQDVDYNALLMLTDEDLKNIGIK